MPPQLLPASAAAFAPRASSVNVVLGSKVEPWLTQTLKRINKIKRPLNSVPQHQRCLTETLSSPNAIWTLASLLLPKAPDSELLKDENPLREAFNNYQMIHLEAYVVHVDMVLRNEVAYKLTPETIEALIKYHRDVHCPNAKASVPDWPEKEQQAKKLHDDFIQAINKFVFRTHVSALEGLEEDGAGELLAGRSEDVKNAVLALMKPLIPPPPRIVDVVRQPPLLPSSPGVWTQAPPPPAMPAPVESWKILPSSPASTTSVDSTATPLWAVDVTVPSPPPPQPAPAFTTEPFTTAGLYALCSQLVTAPIPPVTASLPPTLPSTMLAPTCGVSLGYHTFGWDSRFPSEYAATTM